MGVGEAEGMVQRLRALAALAEDQAQFSAPTQWFTVILVPGDRRPSDLLRSHVHTWPTDIHAGKTFTQ